MNVGRTHLRSVCLLLLLTVLSLAFNGCSSPEENREKQIAQAEALIEAGQAAEAIVLLEELHAQWPDNLAIVEFLAFAHARNNNPSAAADAFILAWQIDPARSDLLLYAAQAREEAGDIDRAAEHYQIYIAEHLDDFAGWQALARLEEQRNRHREAIDAYLQVYRIRPSGETAVALGKLFLEVRNIVQAHHWFDTAAKNHPEEAGPGALLGLLRISLIEENWEQAEKLVARLDSEHAGALDESDLAMARGELQTWRESVEEMERIQAEQLAQAEKNAAEARARAEEEERIARGKAEAEALAQAQAEEERQQSEEEEPAAPETSIVETEPVPEEPEAPSYDQLLAEARSLSEQGRPGSAARFYWRALSLDDSDATTWFALSYALYQTQTWNDAELTALEALRRDPENERYHLHYLNVIREIHPVRTYLSELERVHDRFPENPDVVLALANTYARSQHSHPVAIRYFQLFLRLAPNDSRRAEVEQTIRSLSRS